MVLPDIEVCVEVITDIDNADAVDSLRERFLVFFDAPIITRSL